MKRQIIAALMLVGVVSGCITTNDGPETGGMRPNYGQSFGPPMAPGVKGPYGEGVPIAAPYNQMRGMSQGTMLGMMSQNQPTSIMQMGPNGVMMPQGMQLPPGIPGAMQAPGGMPMMPPSAGNPFQRTGMNNFMPNGGVINANIPPGSRGPGGIAATQFANHSPIGPMFPAQRTQVFFAKPAGMQIRWFTQGPDGKPGYSATPLETPGRYNFAQGAIYRLELTRIPGRPGLPLYPTLEVVPTSPKTNEFLAHNSVPLEFSEEDFKQVVDRNYIVKVIYLPDPQYQDAAGAGPDEIVSTRLEAGQDPIQEALKRGSILLVLRIGNIDQGLQHSPPMTGPVIPGGPPLLPKLPGQGVPGLFQVPFPTPPIAPGVGAPQPLPVLPDVAVPPAQKPELVVPPKKEEIKPIVPPKLEEIKPIVPPFNPPAPNAKQDENVKSIAPPVPPIPLPDEVKPVAPPPALPVNKRTSDDVPRPNVPATAPSQETPVIVPPPSAAPPPLLPMSLPTPSLPPRNDLPIPLLPTSGPR